MTPRQPYRSPFWRPETTPDGAAPVSRATRASPPDEHAGQPALRTAAKRLAGSVDTGQTGYVASDLALFNMLMPTGDQSQPRQANATQPSGHASGQRSREAPDRGRNVQATGSQTYSNADHAQFSKLQAGFADVRGGHQTDSYRPGAVHATAAHGYSQQDLEAFEKLARFGPAR